MSDYRLARLRRHAVVFSFLVGTLGAIPRCASSADDGYTPVTAEQHKRFEAAGVKYETYPLLHRCQVELTQPVDDDIIREICTLPGLNFLTVRPALSPSQWTLISRVDGTLGLLLEGDDWTDSSLEPLTSLRNVHSLTLRKCAISGSGFVHLASLRQLNALWIENCPIENDYVHLLGRIPDLERMTLRACPVTGKGLTHATVAKLYLRDLPINDEGMASIGQMKSLRVVTLDGTGITEPALAHLSRLRNLEYLTLANTKIVGSGLLWLMPLPRLTHLELSNTGLDSVQLEQLVGHSSLEYLSLEGLAVTSHDLRALSTLPGLTSLRLSNAPIGNDACEAIGAMPALESLYVDGTRLDDGCLVALSYAPKLTSVQCQRTKVSKSGARWLARELASNNGKFAFVDTDDVGSEGVINLGDLPERE